MHLMEGQMFPYYFFSPDSRIQKSILFQFKQTFLPS